VPVGATANEMTRRQAALLGLIAARTGLAARTLAKALESKPAPARRARRSSDSVTLVVVALILASITAADFLFPLTPFAWLNWVSVSSLVLATLCFFIASLWTALARSTLPAHARPPSVGAPALDAPGVAYVLSWRTPLIRRLVISSMGLCLAVNLIPVAWMLLLLLQFGLSLFGVHPQPLADDAFATLGRFVLAFTLSICGVIGVGLVYGGVIAATARIRADQDGLTMSTGSGRRQQLLAWSSLQDISWGPGGSGQFAYLVTSDLPTVQIAWPSGPEVASASLPGDGAVPIGADELAALVAARIGKPIQVRG
jgi:hypothetical protein